MSNLQNGPKSRGEKGSLKIKARKNSVHKSVGALVRLLWRAAALGLKPLHFPRPPTPLAPPVPPPPSCLSFWDVVLLNQHDSVFGCLACYLRYRKDQVYLKKNPKKTRRERDPRQRASNLEKLENGKIWRFWCKTSHFEVLLVHDLLQHLATAGEILQQG